MRLLPLCLLFLTVFAGLSARSEESVEVSAWSRATPPGTSNGAIYGQFKNLTDSELLAGRIEFALAARAMIHETVLVNGMTKMEHTSLTISADSTTELVPGATHIMLMGLSSPLVEGCRYEFSVLWQDGQTTHHDFVTGGYGQMSVPDFTGRPCP